MEVAEREWQEWPPWPGEVRPGQKKDDTAKKNVSTPSPAGDFVRIDTRDGSKAPVDRDVEGSRFMQSKSRASKTVQRVLRKPSTPHPALEDLPMLRDTTIEAAVYAGIDYHKRTSAITFGDKQGKVLEQFNLCNNKEYLAEFFGRFVKLECVVESCRGYEWLVDMLQEIGHTVHVGDSRSIKLIAQTRCKTDKIDSRILMELLAIGFLPTTYMPTAKEREYRELLRHRSTLVRTATRSKLRVHALLDKENKSVRYPFSGQGRRTIAELELSESRRQILERELEVIDFAEEHAHQQELRIRRFASREPDVTRLRKIPGFDVLMSMAFLAEVGDVKRFKNADQVAAYLGLVPRVYASGNTMRCGRITKTGSKFMRWMLVQAAWTAIKGSPNLRLRFATISRRRGKKVAIIAIARKLTTIAYRVLRDKSNYKEEKLDAGLARATF